MKRDQCAYGGFEDLIPACKNSATTKEIFCKECFKSVSVVARASWKIAFPKKEEYATALGNYKQRLAIFNMAESITLAKLQKSLF